MTRREVLPHACLQSGREWEDRARAWADTQSHRTSMQRLSWELADRTTHSSMTCYMPTELMYGQKPVIPIEKTIASLVAIPWENEMTQEELLAARIRKLERRPEDLEHARKIMEVAR